MSKQNEEKQDNLAKFVWDAIQSNRPEAVREAIFAGFDVNWPIIRSRDNYRPLHIAAANDRFEICRILIEAGAEVDALGEGGNTPLMSAADASFDVTRLLVEHGANVHTLDAYGESALHKAARSCVSPVIDYLVAQGAKVEQVSKQWKTPLYFALEHGHWDQKGKRAVEALLRHGASSSFVPTNPPNNYKTPFQKVVANDDFEKAKYLIEQHGEDLGQRTVSGKSLTAISKKNAEIRSYLMSYKTGKKVAAALERAAESHATPRPRKSSGLAL